MRRKTQLQYSANEMAAAVEWNAFVTLTFRHPERLTPRTARRLFGQFVGGLRRSLYGRKSKRRIPLCPVMHGGDAKNIHLHMLARFAGDPRSASETVRRVWVSTSGLCGDPTYAESSGRPGEWFKALDLQSDRLGCIDYVFRDSRTDLDGLLLEYTHLGPS